MRIVWWIDHLGPGGAQQMLTRLIENMASSGIYQVVICLNSVVDPNILARIKAVGVEVNVVGKKRFITGVGFISAWQWLRRGQ
ncbi:uncharacterized protein METZ01_LOCUS489714, partial [marine metagenome]